MVRVLGEEDCQITGKNQRPLWNSVIYSLLFCRSVAQSRPTLCNPMNCSTPGFPVLHYFSELAQTHVHWVGDVIQSSHPLWPPSPLALNLSGHQGLLQWLGSLHQVAIYFTGCVWYADPEHSKNPKMYKNKGWKHLTDGYTLVHI